MKIEYKCEDNLWEQIIKLREENKQLRQKVQELTLQLSSKEHSYNDIDETNQKTYSQDPRTSDDGLQ